MASEPEYFYTVELPERYGRMLEELATRTGGMIDTEAMAARLLCDALDQAKALEQAEREATAGPARAPGPGGLDDSIPF